ncbi:DUF6480 family protein [Nesterenkonia cremea]|nr:DUF6480 family protein [Nesterenkonia cremea]
MSGPDSERYGRDETWRNPNLDPDPEGITGDPRPGETPPESNSATASPPSPPPARPPRNGLAITAVVIGVVLLVGLVFVGYIAGLLS